MSHVRASVEPSRLAAAKGTRRAGEPDVSPIVPCSPRLAWEFRRHASKISRPKELLTAARPSVVVLMMDQGPLQSRLRRNLEAVLQRIEAAAARSGRPPNSVRLIAVTKYVSVMTAGHLAAMGCRDLGESRPQRLWECAEAIDDPAVVWHLIGPLQKNKIRKTLKYAAWIHSADSWELLAAIDRIAAEEGVRPAVLLEVNTSQNPAKHGFQPDALLASANRLAEFGHVAVSGLMCMAGWEGDLEGARRDFRSLWLLRDRLRAELPSGLPLEHLSMGMSGDFEIAIEEGATMVRVGSLLFEGIAADAGEA